jgi:hypothetical protein
MIREDDVEDKPVLIGDETNEETYNDSEDEEPEEQKAEVYDEEYF